MEIVENEGETFTTIDMKNSKIRVELPSESYKIYLNDSISQEERFAPIFHSSVVLNALLVALYNFEEHKEFTWSQAIDYRLQNEQQFKALPISEKENIPEIAQRLLGNPFERLIKGLNNFENLTEE
jgi:hypothetical protein